MTFWNESTRTVRKACRCDECGTQIEVGELKVSGAGINIEGDFGVWNAHPECDAAGKALRKAYDLNSDEWVSLHEYEADDIDWLCEDHPKAAARLGLSVYDWREPRRQYGGGFYWIAP